MALALATELGVSINPHQVRVLLLGATRDYIRDLPLN